MPLDRASIRKQEHKVMSALDLTHLFYSQWALVWVHCRDTQVVPGGSAAGLCVFPTRNMVEFAEGMA